MVMALPRMALRMAAVLRTALAAARMLVMQHVVVRAALPAE